MPCLPHPAAGALPDAGQLGRYGVTGTHPASRDRNILVEAMGLEPTNLLTASQALYQLSYAPSGGANASSRGHPPRSRSGGPVPPRNGHARGPNHRPLCPAGTGVSPTLVAWHGRTTSMRWSESGSATGTTRAPTRSTTTTRVRSSTRCACTPTPRGRPTRATCGTTPSATWPSATRPCRETRS